ncbi:MULTISPECIES: MarR family winged helix-turn-helix transcriptional regulator [Streptomyces]|uniref:MarR family winged helix-turn-helix transcriptional regulator n=1 Tax=Streptomyces TaxID=1883 RepID=UPI0006AE4810|nr:MULTISPECIES: MarR family transcriptional regulator [Streptomyces]
MTDIPHSLTDAPLHLLRRALQAYTAQWQRLYPQLTPPQASVLLTLRDRPSISQTHLGELTAIDGATLTPLLRSLEERGYLSRRVDEHNRRRKLVELTKHGADVVEQAQRIAARTDEIMLADLTQEQRRNLMTTLATLAGLTKR